MRRIKRYSRYDRAVYIVEVVLAAVKVEGHYYYAQLRSTPESLDNEDRAGRLKAFQSAHQAAAVEQSRVKDTVLNRLGVFRTHNVKDHLVKFIRERMVESEKEYWQAGKQGNCLLMKEKKDALVAWDSWLRFLSYS